MPTDTTAPADDETVPVSEALLLCPFCGSEPMLMRREDRRQHVDYAAHADACIECRCNVLIVADTDAQVIGMWNSHATPAAPANGGAYGALPARIGRLNLGTRPSDNKQYCSHGHVVPDGHPLYYPHDMTAYDDRDPYCLGHAIDLAESDGSLCERCISADLASGPPLPEQPTAAHRTEREAIAQAIFNATPDRFMRFEQCYPAADAILALITPPDRVAQSEMRLREAMSTAQGIQSGPNGYGRMKVVVDGPKPGTEHALHQILSDAVSSAPGEDRG